MAWLEAEFGWSYRTAARFMNVHDSFKTANLATLEVDVSALYLLSAKSTPPEARMLATDLASNGERISHGAAKTIIEVAKRGTPELIEAVPDITPPLTKLTKVPKGCPARGGGKLGTGRPEFSPGRGSAGPSRQAW